MPGLFFIFFGVCFFLRVVGGLDSVGIYFACRLLERYYHVFSWMHISYCVESELIRDQTAARKAKRVHVPIKFGRFLLFCGGWEAAGCENIHVLRKVRSGANR